MFLSFLRSIPFTQNVFYLSGSEVSLNITLLKVGFHSCLCARLGGQPADHMELLGLQLSRPQSKFNLLLSPVSHSNCTLASHYGLLFLKDGAGAPHKGEEAILFAPLRFLLPAKSSYKLLTAHRCFGFFGY